jgi:O-antigen/teichoic acid export membrane protein
LPDLPTSEQSQSAAATATTGRRVFRGSLWESAAFLLPQVYVLVSSAFVARYLGAAGIGQIAFIVSVQMTVTTIAVLGLPVALNRFVARLIGAGQEAQMRALVSWSWRVQSVLSLVAASVLVAIGLAGAEPRTAWLLAGATAGFSVLHTIPSAFLIGSQRWRDARIVGIVTGLIAMVARVVVVVRGGGVVELLAVDAIIAGFNLVGTAYLARRFGQRSDGRPLDRALRGEVVRFAGIASIGVVIAFIVGQRVEVLFLGHYSTDEEIARYAIPYSLVGALLLIPAALGSAFSPAVATLWGAGQLERIKSGFSRALRLVVLTALVITGAAIAIGAEAIELIFGADFADIELVLVVLVVALPFIPLGYLSTSLLLGIGRQWGLTIIGAVAALANIALAFLLVPPLGAEGAAAANTAAQIVMAIPMLVYATRLIGGVALDVACLARGMAAVLVATAAAAPIAGALGAATGFFLGSAVFCVVMLGAVAILRPISSSDGAWLEATLPWSRPLVRFTYRRARAT